MSKKQIKKNGAAFVAKPGEGIKVVADGTDPAAGKTIEKNGAAKGRKIEARHNRTNHEVALDAMECVLKTNKLCSSAITAARLVAENAVETLKERGLCDDDGELRLARATLRIATEIDRQIRGLLDDLEEADRNSRLA